MVPWLDAELQVEVWFELKTLNKGIHKVEE